MHPPESFTPNSNEQRTLAIVSNGLLVLSGGVFGAVSGGTLAGEAASPQVVEQRQQLQREANDLRVAVHKKQAALNLLDDVKPPEDPIIIALGQELTRDQAQIESLTATADRLDTGTTMDPVGAGVGAIIGAVVFVVGAHLRDRLRRRPS